MEIGCLQDLKGTSQLKGAHNKWWCVIRAVASCCVQSAVSDISEVGKVTSRSCTRKAISIVVLLLEVLVRAELAEQCEQNVEGLNDRLIVLQLVNWDVAHSADNLCVVGDMHVDFWTRERSRLKGGLHLWAPLLH